MQTLISITQSLLVLSIIIGIHELGHFLAARLFGMRVEKFWIGFSPKVFSFKWGETEYSLGAMPFGGFVQIAGTDTEAFTKAEEWEFRAKPAWQRLIVMSGGIIANIFTGFLILVFIFYFTKDYSILKSIYEGLGLTIRIILAVYQSILELFTGQIPVTELSGPIGIYDVFKKQIPITDLSESIGVYEVLKIQIDWGFFWKVTAILSLAVAIFNSIPILPLDGGHNLFLVYEIISGQKPSQTLFTISGIIGIIIIFGAFLVAIIGDITRLIY